MKKVSIVFVGLAAACQAADTITPDKVEAGINLEGLRHNLQDLYEIAKENNGTRAFGTPGYKASVDYVLERAHSFPDEIDTFVQPFNHTFEQTRDIRVSGPDAEDVYVISLMYNLATPLPDGVTAPLVDVPVDDKNGSGCLASQWKDIDAEGKLALVKRGKCAISDKLKNAKAKGAKGVLLYNEEPGRKISSATLGAENRGDIVPVGVITLETGTEWKRRLESGEELEATLVVDSIFEERESWNVFAETKEGSPDSVVVLGAHLDSVQAGPGINDDGSGATALLEILASVRNYTGLSNKIRLAWWGAEESGLVGSLYYTSKLLEEEADKIRYYFNYDMIGSPEPYYHLYQNENSSVGAELLFKYLESHGKEPQYGSFGSGSDYVGFLNLGIPSSGIFTGAGAPEDPCYHLECDNLDNIHWEALTINAKAAGYVAAQLALSLDGVPPREKAAADLRRQTDVPQSHRAWAAVTEEAAHGHTCSHKEKRVT